MPSGRRHASHLSNTLLFFCAPKFLLGLGSEACGREVTGDSCQKKNNIPVEYVSRNILSAGSDSKMLLVVSCLCVFAWKVLIRNAVELFILLMLLQCLR